MNEPIDECLRAWGKSKSLERILDGLHHLYSIKSIQDFPMAMMAVTEDLVPTMTTSVDSIEMATGIATNVFTRQTTLGQEEFMKRWATLCHQHPVIKYAAAGNKMTVSAISDFVTQREFRKTAIYNELFRVCGGSYQLAVMLPVPGFVAGMAMNRETDFTARERWIIELLHPHFTQAFQNAHLLSSLQGEPELDFRMWRDRGLTHRECEVLQWIIAGKRDAEIAVILGAKTRTVSKHVQNILAKLRVETRSAAAAEARRLSTVGAFRVKSV